MIYELECGFQDYAWGKTSKDCFVAQLVSEHANAKNFAEFWMGTHPNCPSKLKSNKEDLGDFLQRQNYSLPFLFKVLSIGKPLSIQTHPTLNLAKKLHQLDPAHYPDSNHKPEMALAITPVKMLYGFSNKQAVSNRLNQLKLKLSSEDNQSLLQDMIEGLTETNFRAAFDRFYELSENQKKKFYSEIAQIQVDGDDHLKLLKFAVREYPEDLESIILFFMDILTLAPGEAIYIEPLVLHAYLEGDLVECMANSDNTIRAGLTKKFKDFSTLFENVEFNPTATTKLRATEKDSFSLFSTPADEFEMGVFQFNEEKSFPLQSKSICLCLKGEGRFADNTYQKGSVFFIDEGESITINPRKSSHFVFAIPKG